MTRATQQFLEIEQIREGVIILKDKSIRGILMVSSQNFALKSEDEQNAIIFQFQTMLNSLDFSCQVIIQSRKLNITGYLEKIKQLQTQQQNDLLRMQIIEYYNFINNIVQSGSIMTKAFYVVVPYTIMEAQKLASSGKFLFGQKEPPYVTDENLQRWKSQLWQRMEFVVLGLRRCGLKTIPLTTPELIELFWSLYHPKEAEVGYYPEIPPEIIT